MKTRALILVATCLTISLATLTIFHDNRLFASSNENQVVFSREEMPYNRSFSDWTNHWWSWLFSMPKEKNAMNDDTGVLCSENQKDQNVWYLTGGIPSEGGAPAKPTTRQCEVPFGKALFVAEANECNHGEYPEIANDDLKGLVRCAVEGNQLGENGHVNAIFDGVKISNLVSNYNITSGPFEANVTDNFIFGGDVGLWNTMSNAYVLFLKPPLKGPHQLDFDVLHTDPKNTIQYKVRYNLIVK